MKGKGTDTITSPAVSIVTATLQLVLMLEDWRPSCLRHVSMTSRIARLICIFLTGEEKVSLCNFSDCVVRASTKSYSGPSWSKDD